MKSLMHMISFSKMCSTNYALNCTTQSLLGFRVNRVQQYFQRSTWRVQLLIDPLFCEIAVHESMMFQSPSNMAELEKKNSEAPTDIVDHSSLNFFLVSIIDQPRIKLNIVM